MKNQLPNMFKNARLILLSMVVAITGMTSCIHNDFDQPPVDGTDPNLTPNITIADLKAMYSGTHIQITDSLLVRATVVADDKSGNFYKSMVIQDETAGILLRLDGTNLYADYPVGRRVYIQLKGLWLGEYNGLIQLGGAATSGTTDEVDYIPSNLFTKFIIKGALNQPVTPIDLTIDQLNNSYQNMLIRLVDVEVTKADTGKTYADAINQLTVNITIEDCNGNTVLLRNSGFADFAGQPLPNGKGTLTAIYSVFGSDQQLFIRDINDLDMTGQRCAEPYLDKDFEDSDIYSGGWSTQQVTGPSVNWVASSFSGDKFAKCSNYNGSSNTACETWLISPPMNLAASTNPILNFRSACNYQGANIQVLVSTNYDGVSLPSSATWTVLPATLSTGGFVWANSGNVSLNAYKVNGTFIAFKYTGTSSDGKTWEVDDIVVDDL